MSGHPEALTPILYLPHGGGPLPVLGDPGHAPLIRFMQTIPQRLGRPAAILVVSAHWEAPRPTLTGGANPELIYDYYGFPPESYEIRYPAPGQPQLAEQIRALLAGQGFDAVVDTRRGYDHGLFIPLKLMYPAADIPCLQLSLIAGLDPAIHIALGRALAPLREQGVLIVGSGLSFHNLPAMFAGGNGRALDESVEFDNWLQAVCTDPTLPEAERERALIEWHKAPHARYCHPREEHLLPLQVCYGAASSGSPVAELVFNDRLMGKRISGLLW